MSVEELIEKHIKTIRGHIMSLSKNDKSKSAFVYAESVMGKLIPVEQDNGRCPKCGKEIVTPKNATKYEVYCWHCGQKVVR